MIGDYVKSFSSDAERTLYELGKNFKVPYVSAVENGSVRYTRDVLYKKKEDAAVGDIVLEGKLIVSPENYSKVSGKDAIGIISMEASHTPDGRPRMVSLDYMSPITPEQGSLNDNSLYWGGYDGDNYYAPDLPLLYEFPIINNLNNSDLLYLIQRVSMYGYLPSDVFETKPVDGNDKYFYYEENKMNPYIPCPYLNNGMLNPLFVAKQYTVPGTSTVTKIANPLADFDGAGNTRAIIKLVKDNTIDVVNNNELKDRYPAALSCVFYNKGKVIWYLPAMGELSYIMVNQGKINKSREILGLDVLSQNGFLSSTLLSDDVAGRLDFCDGCTDCSDFDIDFCVLACAAI